MELVRDAAPQIDADALQLPSGPFIANGGASFVATTISRSGGTKPAEIADDDRGSAAVLGNKRMQVMRKIRNNLVVSPWIIFSSKNVRARHK
jgi:hypothetical protein